MRPRPRLSVVDWAEMQLWLDSSQTSFPGPYSTSMTPYIREILNLFADGNVERIVLCFGAQTSKTQTIQAGLAWTLVNEPSPAMWVMPSQKMAESFSENRLKPFLFSSAELSAMLNRTRRPRKDEIALDGALVNLVGSNSPANLASRPVRVLVLDEVDKYPMSSGKEAAAVDLAKERTMTFPEPKIVEASTPTTADKIIWDDFLAGDQRRYFVPCPHCHRHIVLTLTPEKTAFQTLLGCEASLRWAPEARIEKGKWNLDLVEKTAYFECPFCRGKIFDEHKTEMLRLGQWRPTNKYGAPGVRSYHLPTFYALWKKASWGALAREFLESKNGVTGLQNFINSKCAEPDAGQWEGDGGGRREKIVLANPNTPDDTVRFMTCDRQKDCLYWILRQWTRNGDSLLTAWGKADNFDDLAARAQELNATVVGVDNGYETVDTNKNCLRYSEARRPWIALRGDARESWPHFDSRKRRIEKPWTQKRIDPLIGTSREGTKYITQIMWSNPAVKDMIARFREPRLSPVSWAILQSCATDEYFRQLNAEYKKRVYTLAGKVNYVWTLRSSKWDNHLLDCECMNAALAIYFDILRYSQPQTDLTQEPNDTSTKQEDAK